MVVTLVVPVAALGEAPGFTSGCDKLKKPEVRTPSMLTSTLRDVGVVTVRVNHGGKGMFPLGTGTVPRSSLPGSAHRDHVHRGPAPKYVNLLLTYSTSVFTFPPAGTGSFGPSHHADGLTYMPTRSTRAATSRTLVSLPVHHRFDGKTGLNSVGPILSSERRHATLLISPSKNETIELTIPDNTKDRDFCAK